MPRPREAEIFGQARTRNEAFVPPTDPKRRGAGMLTTLSASPPDAPFARVRSDAEIPRRPRGVGLPPLDRRGTRPPENPPGARRRRRAVPARPLRRSLTDCLRCRPHRPPSCISASSCRLLWRWRWRLPPESGSSITLPGQPKGGFISTTLSIFDLRTNAHSNWPSSNCCPARTYAILPSVCMSVTIRASQVLVFSRQSCPRTTRHMTILSRRRRSCRKRTSSC